MRTLPSFKASGRVIYHVILFAIASCLSLDAQTPKKYNIKGSLADIKSSQPVSFATVALRRLPDSVLVTGASSDIDGNFILQSVIQGQYQIIISAIGYVGVTKAIDLFSDLDAGVLLLHEKAISLNEIVITGERRKAEAGPGKTTYFISSKLNDASHNGADLLGYIPGVQVDIMKNISLAGNSNIIIMVDGKERDRSYLGQLDATRIDKVEVTDAPDSKYDAGVGGVINIILKKDMDSGVNGFINAEMPASRSMVYLFPAYSFNYGVKNLNLFTSYNGELTYLDLTEISDRTLFQPSGERNIFSEQDVRQKNWSHRFHYGFDYSINERNLVSFYSYFNPWSRELDGTAGLTVSMDNIEEKQLSGTKEDTDRNSSSFYSLYYRHNFSKPGSRIEFDLSASGLKSESSTIISYYDGDRPITQLNKVMPGQKSAVARIDYSSPVSDRLTLDAGVKTRIRKLYDKVDEGFRYEEKVFAAYVSLSYNISKYTFKSGLRLEKSSSILPESFDRDFLSLLPDLTANYRISPGQNIKFSFSRTVGRPNLYNLNPYAFTDDLFSVRSGNPFLDPEFMGSLGLGYSNSFGSNFISVQLVSKKRTASISNYSFISENGIFETRTGNLGNIRMNGIQTAASLKIFKIITLNPSFNLYCFSTEGNDLAKRYNIASRRKIAYESGVSAVASFRYDITASVNFQYNSPDVQIQSSSNCDPLYFVSVEKTFFKNYKLGIKSALPFSKNFVYSETRSEGIDFTYRYKGIVKLSAFPLLFSFRYQFDSGKKVSRVEREREEVNAAPKKGF